MMGREETPPRLPALGKPLHGFPHPPSIHLTIHFLIILRNGFMRVVGN